MKNHNKQDNIYVNTIKSENDVKHVSGKTVGSSDKNSFCVYGHKRHAVGSKIINEDGSEAVCTDDSTWQNT